MTTSTLPPPGYPVTVTGRLDGHLSRWLWLVKWVLVIPHLVALAVLWAGFVVLSAAAFVAILLTGRYPRPIFDFNVGVLRWSWRVAYYAYGALATDQYPPFTLAERPDYPATLQVEYPQRLSRGLVLVKWWLLALPHYVVVAVFVGSGVWAWRAETGWQNGPGLVSLLTLVAGVVLLVTGRYPAPVFDFVLGMNRWALRVAAYAGLMTDQYPPFRLDQGGGEPGAVLLERSPTGEDTPGPGRSAGPGWTGARSAGAALGALVCLLGLVAGGGGTALLVADQAGRNEAGLVSTGSERYRSGSAALVGNVDLFDAGPAWLSAADQLGTVTVTVRSTTGQPVFVGIARQSEVRAWLAGTSYDRVTRLGSDPAYDPSAGSLTAPDPASASFWVASSSGPGERRLRWTSRPGAWSVVVMNADGTPGIGVQATAAATLPHLGSAGLALVAVGAVLLLAGVLAVVLAVPRRSAARGALPDRPLP